MKRGLVAVVAVLVVLAALGAWWLRPRNRMPTTEAVFAEVIARIDTDHDGRISRAEWEACGAKKGIFDAYDFDADGFLDEREFQAMFYSLDPKPNI